MPASLSICRSNIRKKCKLTLGLLLFPLFFFGQTLTGLWTGALSSDSNTVRKDQLFEIALTEYRGKVYGYSRSEFIVNDTLYYIVKRVKGTITGDICEVTDDEIIAFNFRGRLDKGVKVTSTFRRNNSDSSWYLAGTWKTNATKKYYSVTGKVALAEEKDLTASKLFPHLEELKLADEMAFYKDRKEGAPIVKIARPEKVKTEYSFNPDPGAAVAAKEPDLRRAENSAGPAITAPNPAKEEPEVTQVVVKKPETHLPKTETKNIPVANVPANPVVTDKTIAVNKAPVETADKKDAEPDIKKTEPVIAKNADPVKPSSATEKKMPVNNTVTNTVIRTENKPSPAVTSVPKPVIQQKNNDVVARETSKPASTATIENKKPATEPAKPIATITPAPKTEIKNPETDITQKAAVIDGRKSEFSQIVNFTSDSLELALYDNGEIDGDTVSVYMNGEVLMAKQGLKASAIKKTIYFKPGEAEDFTLVLFADNLGKYPPNTGLLVVHDGEDIYHLRFSSDFQKSSGIVFRRKN